jgi:hypothetical protein
VNARCTLLVFSLTLPFTAITNVICIRGDEKAPILQICPPQKMPLRTQTKSLAIWGSQKTPNLAQKALQRSAQHGEGILLNWLFFAPEEALLLRALPEPPMEEASQEGLWWTDSGLLHYR